MALDTSTARSDIAKIYIAAFNRAPDAGGLDFWTKAYMGGTSLSKIAEGFASSQEFTNKLTPNAVTNSEYVAKIYLNVFGRTVDSAGSAFWTAALDSGKVTKAGLLNELVAAASANGSNDGQMLANKATVGVAYATSSVGSSITQEAAIASVTADSATVTTALAAIAAVANTVTLTSGNDNVSGAVFDAPQTYTPGGTNRINSLQDNDKLIGTGTADVLNVTIGTNADTGDATITPKMTGVETVNVKFDVTGYNLDMQDSTGTTTVNIERMDQGATNGVINMTSIPTTLSISTSSAQANQASFTFNDTATTGTTDTTTLALNAAKVAAVVLQSSTGNTGIETINLQSNTSANSLGQLTAQDVKTLNISGSQNLTFGATTAVTGAQGTEATTYTAALNNVAGSLTTIDASTMTGVLDITLGAELNAGLDNTSGLSVQMAVTGGTANDVFRLAQGANIDAATSNVDSITGGTGTDTLVLLGAAAQTITASTSATIKSVEALQVRTGHDSVADNAAEVADVVTVDADAFDSLATIYVRNEGQGDTNAAVATTTIGSKAEAMTVNLNDLTAAQSLAITLAHGTTGNNGILNNTVNIDIASSLETSTTDTATVTLTDGVNTNSRFNAIINAADYETFTITDSDTESNTIALAGEATHTTKVSISGGSSTTFINLDTTTAGANGGMYMYDVAGTTTDTTGQVTDYSATANQIKLNAATIDASAATSSVVVRVDTNAASVLGAQTITMGTGNDTVIFDLVADTRAGLTISDTVTGGTGTDTLVIDGNLTVAGTIALGASEWTNVSGFESIRVIGAGAGSNYSLTLTDTLITNNNLSGNLSIVNDNDSVNDTAAAVDTGVGSAESALTIDARSLTALTSTKKFSYNGEEGASRTNDTIIFADANINGYVVIDGGAVNNIATDHVSGAVGNSDILEVRNSAVVSTGDLENISNMGNIKFTNDLAVTQVSTLQLNDTIVDRMVDSYQSSVSRAATNANVEQLLVTAVDNMNVASATTGLTLEAGTLTDKSDLTILLGRGANNIATGAGQDNVTLLGNYVAGTYAATVNGVALNSQSTTGAVARAVTDTINLGTGTDTLTTYGAINLVGATLTGVENLVANSAVVMTAAQYRALTSIRFEGNTTHQLAIVGDGGTALDLSKITLASGGLTIDTTAGGTATTTTNSATDSSTTGDVSTGTVDPFTGTSIPVTGNLTAVNGVAEVFTYNITSTAAGVAVSTAGGDWTITGFNPTEDSIIFNDAGTFVTKATFLTDVTVSSSAINNKTDIIFDANSSGVANMLTLGGVVDGSLSTVNFSIA